MYCICCSASSVTLYEAIVTVRSSGVGRALLHEDTQYIAALCTAKYWFSCRRIIAFSVDVVRMPVVDMTMLRRACSVNKIILCVWYSRVHDHSDIASDTLYAADTAAATSVNAYSTSKQFHKTVLQDSSSRRSCSYNVLLLALIFSCTSTAATAGATAAASSDCAIIL
jgi:hypothetical protein